MAFGLVLVEVCDANPACVPELFQFEQQLPGVSVLETSCLSECDLCEQSPYVLVDGQVQEATDMPSLLTLLKQVLTHRLADL